LSDENQVVEIATPEEQKRMNSREHLWRAAMWAGFTHQEACIKALQSGKIPWFSELAPLTSEERVYIMGTLCKRWFPEMSGEAEADAWRTLRRMYGVKNRTKRRRHAH
jgi:hypothetical protein